jgi:hypothetical protein
LPKNTTIVLGPLFSNQHNFGTKHKKTPVKSGVFVTSKGQSSNFLREDIEIVFDKSHSISQILDSK